MGHTFYDINLHVIFSTKDRRNALYRDMRAALLAYMGGIVRAEGGKLLHANAVEDHVHLLLSVRPAQAPAELVRTIKAGSSRWVHGEYPDLREFSWQAGYGVFSVSHSAIPAVKAYIADQGHHHGRVSFQEEYRLFLEKHGVPFDPEHYLD